MSRQSGLSSLLAAAASLLVVGFVAAGTPAVAASEEDLAAPNGSFVSTMPVPASIQNIAYVARQAGERPSALINSEEDLAAPQGSFLSTMPVPGGNRVQLASENDVVDYDELNRASLREAVAASLE